MEKISLHKLKFLNKKYREGNPLITDEHWDKIFKNFVSEHGHVNLMDSDYGVTKKMEIPMGSMRKIEDQEALEKWLGGYSGEIILSAKLDGISIFKEQWLAQTRGEDGINGTIVTNIFDKISGGKNFLSENKKQRGECVISWKNFAKPVFAEDMHPRNTVSGIFRSKEIVDKEILSCVEFIPFEDLDTFKTCIREDLSLKICPKDLNSNKIEECFESWNKVYPCDGVIITKEDDRGLGSYETNSYDPKYSRAYKTKSFYGTATTSVKRVVRQKSKYGRFSPVVELSPAVKLEGSIIKRIYVDNEMFVKVCGIGQGTQITLFKGGGIIPRILKIGNVSLPNKRSLLTEKMKTESIFGVRKWLIDNYSLNGEIVDNYQEPVESHTWKGLDIFTTEDDDNILIRKCEHFLSLLGFKHIGSKHIQKWITTKMVSDLSDFINLFENPDKIRHLLGDGEYLRFIKEINKVKNKPMSKEIFMSSVSVFKGLGVSKLRIYCLEGIEGKGLGDVAKKEIEENLAIWRVYEEQLKKCGFNLTDPKVFKGKVYCHTECRISEDIKEILERRGDRVVDSYSKQVSVLVKKDENTNTSKTKKAIADGIKIITLKQLTDSVLPRKTSSLF